MTTRRLVMAGTAIVCLIGSFLILVGLHGKSLGLPVTIAWRVAFFSAGLLLVASGVTIFRQSREGEGKKDEESLSVNNHNIAATEDQNSAWSRTKPFFRVSPTLFLWLLIFAAFFEAVVIPPLQGSRFRGVIEHITVALLIASILGVTYEYVLSEKREEGIRKLINNLGEDLQSSLDGMFQLYAAATPEVALRMLRDVAIRTDKMPTLYNPPRSEGEYTIAGNLEYFDLLIKFREEKFCTVIREWLNDPNPNVKFLASDFIGRYKLIKLTSLLRNEISIQRPQWDKLAEEDKRWMLNYVWAVSCCDAPKFRSLDEFLRSQADNWAQEWILFVAFQMPEPAIGNMIYNYLQARSKNISDTNLTTAISALHFLQDEGVCDAKSVIERSAFRFSTSVALREQIKSLFQIDLSQPSERGEVPPSTAPQMPPTPQTIPPHFPSHK
ncbi:MAG: hypothetical protein WAN65_28290 [Candidatus Sulfotelmatobacter sp.]